MSHPTLAAALAPGDPAPTADLRPSPRPRRTDQLEESRMHATLCRWGFVLALALFLTTSDAHAGVKLPNGKTVDQVDFERHVMGVLGRFGCASGSCHGSFQGKGGLQVSLFGYDPAIDFQHLVRSGSGRRVNPADPDNSLM